MKKILLCIVLFFASISMISCVSKADYGVITNLYIQDETIFWDEIDDAKYYEVSYFYEESAENIYLVNLEICFVGHTNKNLLNLFDDAILSIEIYYEDGSSDKIENIETNFKGSNLGKPYIYGMGNFADNNILWHVYQTERDVIDYTVHIEEKDFDLMESEFSLEDTFTMEELVNRVYQMTVTSNYGLFRKAKSNIFYAFSPRYNPLIDLDIEYDFSSNEDLTFEFTEGEIINFSTALEEIGKTCADGIFTLNGNEVTVNRYYFEVSLTNIFFIYTENHVYRVNVI